jgi:TonB family protein
MKVRPSFVLLPLLLMPAAFATSKEQTAAGLLERAAQTSGPTPVVKGSYRIEYRLTFHRTLTGPISGTYSTAWISHDQWRTEVSTPVFSSIEVTDGASRWVARKPHQYEPEDITELISDLMLAADVKLSPNEKVSKIREDNHGGVRLQCIEISRQNVMPSLGEESLCFDEGSGALVRITRGAQRTEFSDFDTRNGALIARKAQQFRGHDLISEAELASLDPQSPSAAGLLDHPADARQLSNCEGPVTSGMLVQSATPVYPKAARAARQTGTVEIYASIDIDGSLKDMEIGRGVSKLLDDAAMEAVRKWRYKPYMCGGNPVQVETTVSVNFSL